MYRAIVAMKVRQAWKHVNDRDHAYVLDQLAPSFEYRFVGDHAMGGIRRTREALDEWFQRVFRLFPSIRFEVKDVLVKGWPWRTTAVALIRVHASVADEQYENELAQTLELRWGRITKINTLEDTQKLERVLERLAAAGVAEAQAEPIADRVPVTA
jgi:ketosteroid isomerase-like protein